jgi:hypothetical protein
LRAWGAEPVVRNSCMTSQRRRPLVTCKCRPGCAQTRRTGSRASATFEPVDLGFVEKIRVCTRNGH